VKYQELASELAASLHVWYSHQWREANEALLAAMTALDQRTEDFERAHAAATACEDGLTQLRTAIDERRREIGARERDLAGVQEYVRDLERRAALDTERQRMLGERLSELAAELTGIEADIAAQSAAGMPAGSDEAERQLAAARAELEQQRERLAHTERDLAEAQRAALEAEQAATRATLATEDLGRRIDEAADEAARLRRERDAGIEERRKALNELAAWARDYASLAAEIAGAGSGVDGVNADRRREADALSRARQTYVATEAELREVRTQADAIAVRLEVIQELEIQPSAPDAGVRSILEAGGRLKRESVPDDVELRGVVGLLGQLLRVPPGLEKAIEAALAENLFAIVMERETDMRAAVNLLLAGDSGRAVMYALDAFSESRPLHLMKERGIIGVAAGLVKCDSKYRRLVDTLLGRTVVVEDLALAHRVVRRGLAAAVATLDGVLVRPVGSVAAGTSAMVHASFVHEREVGDLPQELARLQRVVEQREQELDDASRRMQESERRIEELDRAADAARERKAWLDARALGARGRLVAFRTRLLGAAGGDASRRARIAALLDDRERMIAERATHTDNARAAAAIHAGLQDRLSTLERERQSLSAAVAELAAQVAHLDGATRAERSATQGERLARERLTRQLAEKQEQHSRLQGEVHDVEMRRAATEQELREKRAESAGLAEDLAPAREEVAQFESRERSLSAQLAESNERLRTSERAQYDAEAMVRARRDELDSLAASLRDEGFVASPDGEITRLPDPQPERELEPVAVSHDVSAGENNGPPTWLRTDDDTGNLPPVRGGSTIDATEVRDRIADLRAQIRGLGPINQEAATEYADSRERYDYLTGQLTDLAQAEEQLLEAVGELETVIRERFRSTFKLVNGEFERYFSAFFRGGTARLELGETDENGLPGIEIVAQPPGKKLGSLALLSGGERSLTAVALLFALLQASPSPICVLDEVDAALDEANVGRFVEELRALAERTQFIIITHNRRTIENADTIYGVSMGADNVSRVLSLKLEDVQHRE
jgi:chromosome segregation protein